MGGDFVTRARLAADLEALGIVPGDLVMVHAAMSRVGRMLNGPDALIGALGDVLGPSGTLMAYADWDTLHDELLDGEGRVPEAWRPHVPAFDVLRSRATRDNGLLPEFLRTTPGARRSENPGASMVALGARADWVTEGHAIDYGYGPDSPLARLVAAGGKVLMVGCPLDTMTLLHHAEHLAKIPGKRFKRHEVPFATQDGVAWRMVEEFDTSDPVVAGLSDDYFAGIVTEFLATGQGVRGPVGEAASVLVPAAPITRFAVEWLERRFAR